MVLASVNPLTPKSDKHLLSPHNITPESHAKVMRIKEKITNWGSSWFRLQEGQHILICMFRSDEMHHVIDETACQFVLIVQPFPRLLSLAFFGNWKWNSRKNLFIFCLFIKYPEQFVYLLSCKKTCVFMSHNLARFYWTFHFRILQDNKKT